MKTSAFGMMLLFAGMLSVPAVAATPPTMSDLAQLDGAWTCRTAANSIAVREYIPQADGSLVMDSAWQNPGGASGAWQQRFFVDPKTGTLSTKNVGSNGWIFTSASASIDGNTIEFDGNQIEGRKTVPLRERLTIDTANSFSHTWDTQIDGKWLTTSAAVCERPPAVPN